MPTICLSYRRSDSSAIGGRIYDHLVRHFGGDFVFMDVTGIPYGVDFRKRIQSEFAGAKVLVALIGPSWLGHKEGGSTRIQDRLDPVRTEIYTALASKLLVIPVLVDGANMPSSDDLPRNIREFAYLNAMRVDSGADFSVHIARLIALIDRSLGREVEAAPNAKSVESAAPLPLRQIPSSQGPDSPAKNPYAVLLTYFVSAVILLLLAHYLIEMKLDAKPLYVSIAATVVSASCGFLLFRIGFGAGQATLFGLAVSLVVVAGMLAIVGLVDRHQILPRNIAEWQETLELVVTITLATTTGNLLACYIPTALRRVRQF
jgi:TIR domain